MSVYSSGRHEPHRQPRKAGLHPLVDRLLGILRFESTSKVWVFDTPLTGFVSEVAAISDNGELVLVLGDLTRLGYFLEVRRRSPDAARAVIELLQGVLPQLALELFEGGAEGWRGVRARVQQELDSSASGRLERPGARGGVSLRGRSRKKTKA